MEAINQIIQEKEAGDFITLKDLIYIVPDLINLFLPGFIFMITFNWLNNKKNDISLITICGLFISSFIRIICSVLHSHILTDIIVNNQHKILIYIIIGFTGAFIFTYIIKSPLSQSILYHTSHKSVNDNIFNDIIDYDKKTIMNIFLKSSDLCYVGQFSIIEENGINSWIAMSNYMVLDTKNNSIQYDSSKNNYKSTVAINLSNIDRIELIYENDTKIWDKINGNI